MGICIHMSISTAVKEQEWEKVYNETLQLVKAFSLAERRKVKCHGIETICLVPTKERKEKCGWNYEKTRIGWHASGDYETLHMAEDYFLPRDLCKADEVNPDAGDAVLGALPEYWEYDRDNPGYGQMYSLWGSKTQGEPYHIFLLAIACLIESRLGEKAFVYGDITRGQCRKAVELANKYLEKPIDIPARCDMVRFQERVSNLSYSESEQLSIFERFYLGTKDANFGQYIRDKYSEEACNSYWKDQFKHFMMDTLGLEREAKQYLLWGFDLRNLCRLVNYNDKENNPRYEKFVEMIMDAKLHQKVKNCEDILDIDQEESSPYDVNFLLARFVHAGARNRKVDRYIPIEEIRKVLKEELGDKCDVDIIIDNYLAKEEEIVDISKGNLNDDDIIKAYKQDAAGVFNQAMFIKKKILEEIDERYDISDCEELLYYKAGDTILPSLKEVLEKSFTFYKSMLREEYYCELMEQTAVRRCEWLVEQNRYILIRDKDWDKIFMDIKKHDEAFSRYYPMVRIKLNSEQQIYMIIAIVLNDELYNYCEGLIV